MTFAVTLPISAALLVSHGHMTKSSPRSLLGFHFAGELLTGHVIRAEGRGNRNQVTVGENTDAGHTWLQDVIRRIGKTIGS
jgi:hypothetical protein